MTAITNKAKFQALMSARNIFQNPSEHNYYMYKGKKICIEADIDNQWMLFWADCDIVGAAEDDLVELAHQANNHCGSCGGCSHSESKGVSRMVFGKVVENSCTATLCFPDFVIDDEVMQKIIRLVDLRVKEIDTTN